MLRWAKPEIIEGFGIVYRTKCGRFLIDHRDGDAEYRLVQFQDGRMSDKAPFLKLKHAKAAAEQRVTLGLVGPSQPPQDIVTG